MIKKYIKAAELVLSYRKFNKYVGNNFDYRKNEIIDVLEEMLKEKEEVEEYEECQLILNTINYLKANDKIL